MSPACATFDETPHETVVFAAGGALVAHVTPTDEDGTMTTTPEAGPDRDPEGFGYHVGYGVRLGPAPRSPWYMGARIEGYATTDISGVGGYLVAGGNVGVQIWRFIIETGIGFGALGIGSLKEGNRFGDITPAAMGELNAGFPISPRVRLFPIRFSVAGRVVAEGTDLAGGFFFGVGAEWTPDDG